MENTEPQQQKIFAYFNKIIACINSCTNEEQLQSCKNSIDTFTTEFSTHVALEVFKEELNYQFDIKINSLPK